MTDSKRYGLFLKEKIQKIEDIISLYLKLDDEKQEAFECFERVFTEGKNITEKIDDGFNTIKKELKPYITHIPRSFELFASEATYELSDRRSDSLIIK